MGVFGLIFSLGLVVVTIAAISWIGMELDRKFYDWYQDFRIARARKIIKREAKLQDPYNGNDEIVWRRIR